MKSRWWPHFYYIFRLLRILTVPVHQDHMINYTTHLDMRLLRPEGSLKSCPSLPGGKYSTQILYDDSPTSRQECIEGSSETPIVAKFPLCAASVNSKLCSDGSQLLSVLRPTQHINTPMSPTTERGILKILRLSPAPSFPIHPDIIVTRIPSPQSDHRHLPFY